MLGDDFNTSQQVKYLICFSFCDRRADDRAKVFGYSVRCDWQNKVFARLESSKIYTLNISTQFHIN